MKAVISGIAGQDGSYLAELLLSEGYNVTGVYRRISSGTNYDNVSECLSNPNFNLVEGDICDSGFMTGLVINQKPELFFNQKTGSI
jgi:GDPmannose 4,6-dehydratase